MAVLRACSRCGTMAEMPDEETLPEGWSFAVEGKRVLYHCNPCVRENLRAIEGRLSTDWWE